VKCSCWSSHSIQALIFSLPNSSIRPSDASKSIGMKIASGVDVDPEEDIMLIELRKIKREENVIYDVTRKVAFVLFGFLLFDCRDYLVLSKKCEMENEIQFLFVLLSSHPSFSPFTPILAHLKGDLSLVCSPLPPKMNGKRSQKLELTLWIVRPKRYANTMPSSFFLLPFSGPLQRSQNQKD
jgi:hypothetical protein